MYTWESAWRLVRHALIHNNYNKLTEDVPLVPATSSTFPNPSSCNL